ncbi:DEAD/DEAH box helicase [Trichlorobacter ammonificans]|uniref:ATP-dependent RNA helicase RhlE n=1 Tax=Trichlorobacter ammonificans TaxID=2916410 RepID=A0ABM9DBI2_9BACT|nr:DEAD/DEAH box helicase [Trichlorobacter ammonificans]CAH2032585.1 ATP-dependent RNA helicase RhlE [Trichlorobacter ammonificans]
MSFENLNLNPSLLKALTACGYSEPTPIQAQAIPQVLTGQDLLASAQTGTGKTAAFVLPALHRILANPAKPGRGPRVLVLTPTRELATQVTDAVRTYGRFMRIRSGAILGGMPYREQLQLLSSPVDLIVATPGRLIDHLERGRLSLNRLEMLILDEADRMLDMGFIEPVESIAAATPADRQTLLFSATLDARIAKLAGNLLTEPATIRISPKQITHDHIEQRLLVADNLGHKMRLLHNLVSNEEMEKAIIFSATKRDTETLAQELAAEGHAVRALHGDMSQGARNRAITDMRRGKVRLLVATDVAARGLDVTGISHVINFDLPRFAEDYVHRIGRTGRAGASGVAISFASPAEQGFLGRIEKFTGKQIAQHMIEGLEPKSSLRTAPSGRNGNRSGGRPAGGSGKSFGKPFNKRRSEQAAPAVYSKKFVSK